MEQLSKQARNLIYKKAYAIYLEKVQCKYWCGICPCLQLAESGTIQGFFRNMEHYPEIEKYRITPKKLDGTETWWFEDTDTHSRIAIFEQAIKDTK